MHLVNGRTSNYDQGSISTAHSTITLQLNYRVQFAGMDIFLKSHRDAFIMPQ
jgi:hypothetical protein